MIRCFRLVNGEDVVSEFEEKSDSIVVENPFRIVMHQTQQGIGLGLLPLIFAGKDEKVEICKSKILYLYNPEEELENQYRQITTGLHTPSSKVILG